MASNRKNILSFLLLPILFLSMILFTDSANAQAADRECSAEVILVMDQSGSMLPYISAVENTAIAFVDKLMSEPSLKNRAGIVWYSNTAVLSQPLTYDVNAVKSAITPPLTFYGTNMEAGIQTAHSELTANGESGVSKIIVHLTDGSPYDPAATIAALNAAKASGIKVINIGLGSSANDSFLTTNASQTCPTATYSAPSCYWKAPTTADLDGIYNDILSLVGDQDGDGYQSKKCGGDDCDDSAPAIYPGQPCYNECFGSILKSGICQAGSGICVYNTEIKRCDGMGDKCKIDICQNNANADDACLQDAGLNVCGGFVPCGRMANNPNTPWDDTATCDFCHIAVLLNLFMDFLVSMALIISILAIVFTGFLFITSGGNPENRNKAKSYFKGIMIGFFVIFLAWLLIDFLFIVWGFLDPMGGQWNVVCE